MRAHSTLTVAVIGTTQTLPWASSYYLPAIPRRSDSALGTLALLRAQPATARA
jgi:hypothetical protein